MPKITHFSFFLCAVMSVIILGCMNPPIDPSYSTSESLPSYSQSSFEQYIEETQSWLKDNRVFVTDDKDKEVAANAPYEIRPETPNGQAVLLVHGLGDSPYSFIDVAKHLAERGYVVRTVLLPGHGSKVGDLILPTLSDWQGVVDHHIGLLKQEYDSVWLGGYSTGANLVTSEAMSDPSIKGLLLFSPAFQPKSSVVKYAEFASHFITWADQDPEDNYLRYNSVPMNGAAVYYQTSTAVRHDLEDAAYTKPVFVIMSEGDSVIDTQYVQATFANKMVNPNNRLIWQGETPLKDSRAIQLTMKLDTAQISNGSHMGLLFSPENPDYGILGDKRICSNGQTEEGEASCLNGGNVWFSAWGYRQEGKVYARLTYNPYFNQTMQIIDQVMSESL
ncbi:alpha/beta fold hydrolase [Vibrio sp. DW001]|uniref:alpha/beta hydrolase n=1 Tax=Vibrio sp. DW001 TaxID=2912315 RepID=UPI0023B1143D|nr:alpha/beta fold hydrolase [Vibrio sp. DW001]WED28848.1 alpha/beta fold hydrolase [Vibrio sp. DW001]